MRSEIDVVKVLIDDGLDSIDWKTFRKYENISTISLAQLRDELGMGSWAVRIAYNDLFGGVIIQQNSGEGNRKHYHPDADENWIIMDGVWKWWIENKGEKIVKQNDIVVVPKGVPHLITCIEGPGARYAITKPDVNHVYVNEK